MDIKDIFSLLVENVLSKTPKEFINYCEKSGMIKKDPISDIGQYSQLPPYDSRYCYEFASPKAVSVIFEIFVVSDKIMQAGVNLYYKNNLLSHAAENKFKEAKLLLNDYFGLGIPLKAKNTIGYNYGNNRLLGYVSLIKNDNVNIKIGNAEIWNSYYPINKN